jgi:ABC-type antimicrobial peptide transport system permease subunit
MSRIGSLATVLAASLAYIVAVVLASSTVLFRSAKQARAAQSQGDFLYGFAIPAWWWALLLLPPIALVGWWILRHGRRGA